jgi:hypothetical protein
MRIQSIFLPFVVFVAVVGAFAAGHYIGQFDAQKAAAAASYNFDASRSAEVFMLVSSARQALRESKPMEAERVLVFYAALQAPRLAECSSSPACAAWVGRMMPTKAQLEEVIAAERTIGGRK